MSQLPLRVEAGHLWPTETRCETWIPLGQPYWVWEGRSSSLAISHDEQTVTVLFHLDVRIAPWWDVTLSDDGTDLYASFHDSCQQTPDWFAAWSTWDELLADRSDAAQVLKGCFRRCECDAKLGHVTR